MNLALLRNIDIFRYVYIFLYKNNFELMKKLSKHIPSIVLIAILMITLPAKFVRWDHLEEIFMLTWQAFWAYWDIFPEIWIYVIAWVESLVILFLVLWIWFKKYKFYGWVLALFVLVWALFSHLFTPLGINVGWDGGLLFFLALIGTVASLFIIKKTYKIFS